MRLAKILITGPSALVLLYMRLSGCMEIGGDQILADKHGNEPPVCACSALDQHRRY